MPMNEDEHVIIELDGTLDLHQFRPSEIKELIKEFLYSCMEKGIYEGRIIHGKGIGTLREIVHSQLKNDSRVLSYSLGDHRSGGWGSTSFCLKKPPNNGPNLHVA